MNGVNYPSAAAAEEMKNDGGLHGGVSPRQLRLGPDHPGDTQTDRRSSGSDLTGAGGEPIKNIHLLETHCAVLSMVALDWLEPIPATKGLHPGQVARRLWVHFHIIPAANTLYLLNLHHKVLYNGK